MATAKTTTKKTAAASKAAPAPAPAAVSAEPAVSAPAAPKKAPAKKTAPKASEPVATVVFEYGEKQVVAKELLTKAVESFRSAHTDIEIQEVQLYIKADDNCAYIVVNGVEYPEDKISF